MNETLILVLDGVAGVALGVIFFGGLWWTIRTAAASPRAALWFMGSLLLRMGVALGGFYLVSGGAFKPLLACLSGFFLARIFVTRMTANSDATPAAKAHHAT